MEIKHVEDGKQGRFVVYQGDVHVGEIDYLKRGNTRCIVHTGTNPDYRGQGIAGEATKHALDYFAENDLKVDPACPYASSFIEKNPEYKGLLDQ